MKYFILPFVFFMVFACTTNTKKSFTTTECSVLFDITGSNRLSLKHIESTPFLSLFDLQKNPENGAVYRQSFITETFLNFTHQYKLDGVGSFLTNNEFDREEAIKNFESKITSALAEAKKASKTRPASSVYVPFTTELKRLKNSTAHRKILVLFSDLNENSDFLSFLSKEYQKELVLNPDRIIKHFEQELSLPNDLTGITVYIIHEPRADDNFLFKHLSRVYKKTIEQRNGNVFIQANLVL